LLGLRCEESFRGVGHIWNPARIQRCYYRSARLRRKRDSPVADCTGAAIVSTLDAETEAEGILLEGSIVTVGPTSAGWVTVLDATWLSVTKESVGDRKVALITELVIVASGPTGSVVKVVCMEGCGTCPAGVAVTATPRLVRFWVATKPDVSVGLEPVLPLLSTVRVRF
jgi:hypothetical protein